MIFKHSKSRILSDRSGGNLLCGQCATGTKRKYQREESSFPARGNSRAGQSADRTAGKKSRSNSYRVRATLSSTNSIRKPPESSWSASASNHEWDECRDLRAIRGVSLAELFGHEAFLDRHFAQ
jgi:hypothetical protein